MYTNCRACEERVHRKAIDVIWTSWWEKQQTDKKTLRRTMKNFTHSMAMVV